MSEYLSIFLTTPVQLPNCHAKRIFLFQSRPPLRIQVATSQTLVLLPHSTFPIIAHVILSQSLQGKWRFKLLKPGRSSQDLHLNSSHSPHFKAGCWQWKIIQGRLLRRTIMGFCIISLPLVKADQHFKNSDETKLSGNCKLQINRSSQRLILLNQVVPSGWDAIMCCDIWLKQGLAMYRLGQTWSNSEMAVLGPKAFVEKNESSWIVCFFEDTMHVFCDPL